MFLFFEVYLLYMLLTAMAASAVSVIILGGVVAFLIALVNSFATKAVGELMPVAISVGETGKNATILLATRLQLLYLSRFALIRKRAASSLSLLLIYIP